jgi:hypothetical protein
VRSDFTVPVAVLAVLACGGSFEVGEEVPARGDLRLVVQYTDEEVSRDSNGEEVRVSLTDHELTYERRRSGFGAEGTDDVHTVVRLDAEELARVESWLAEGDLLRATSLEDESEVAPGPHQRVGITVLIDLDAETHEFSLTGIRSVKGERTEFGRSDELARAMVFLGRLTDLVAAKSPATFGSRKSA